MIELFHIYNQTGDFYNKIGLTPDLQLHVYYHELIHDNFRTSTSSIYYSYIKNKHHIHVYNKSQYFMMQATIAIINSMLIDIDNTLSNMQRSIHGSLPIGITLEAWEDNVRRLNLAGYKMEIVGCPINLIHLPELNPKLTGSVNKIPTLSLNTIIVENISEVSI